jgi:hypothetical protein
MIPRHVVRVTRKVCDLGNRGAKEDQVDTILGMILRLVTVQTAALIRPKRWTVI